MKMDRGVLCEPGQQKQALLVACVVKGSLVHVNTYGGLIAMSWFFQTGVKGDGTETAVSVRDHLFCALATIMMEQPVGSSCVLCAERRSSSVGMDGRYRGKGRVTRRSRGQGAPWVVTRWAPIVHLFVLTLPFIRAFMHSPPIRQDTSTTSSPPHVSSVIFGLIHRH